MKQLLFLLLTTILFARTNPFIPAVTNENNKLIKKTMFQKQEISLPNDARILQSVTLKYQTLTSSIKEIEIPINKAIDWHNPLILSTKQKKLPSTKVNISFLNFYIKNHTALIQTKNKMIRKFMLVKPFRYVIDFKANKNFLTFSKKTNTFIKKIVLGNHSNFYRVVLYLDGTYKINIKNTNKGYLLEFR